MSASDDDDWKSRRVKYRKTKIALGVLAGAALTAAGGVGAIALGLWGIIGVTGATAASVTMPAWFAGGVVAVGGAAGGAIVGMKTRHPDPEHRWTTRKSKVLRVAAAVGAFALGAAAVVATGGMAIGVVGGMGLTSAATAMGAWATSTAGTYAITGAAAAVGLLSARAGYRRVKRGRWDSVPLHGSPNLNSAPNL